jgi:hypothetical protein
MTLHNLANLKKKTQVRAFNIPFQKLICEGEEGKTRVDFGDLLFKSSVSCA